MEKNNLKLIVMPNIERFGSLVDSKLKLIRGVDTSFRVNVKIDRFANTEGKATIIDSVRGKDIFLLCDVGNYGPESEYISRGRTYMKSSDDHFQDLLRVISAMNGKENSLHVIMPLLYQSRQDKRKGNESLDCAEALRDLERRGTDGIITFDVHNQGVENALSTCTFDNLYPTYSILKRFIDEELYNPDNIMVISPDTGAMDRARFYADILGCDVGAFYKRRNYAKVENGKNLIEEHKFLGGDVQGKDLIITDDMIASGGSMLEVAYEMKQRGARRIYLLSTFPLFTEGEKSINDFDQAYNQGVFYKLYTTNVTYVPEDVINRTWYVEVDCSKYLAKIINAISESGSIREFMNGKEKLVEKMKTLGKYPTTQK